VMLPLLWFAAQPVHRAADERVLLALLLAAAGVLILWIHHAIRQFTMRRFGQPDRDRERNTRRRTRVLTVILLLAASVFFNLPLRAGFLISLPWLNQLAQRIRLHEARSPALPLHGWVGIYQISFELSSDRPNGEVVLVLHQDQHASFVLTEPDHEPNDYNDPFPLTEPMAHEHGHLIGSWYWRN